jgi:DNA repair exonuclease SbcCD ATPase subunit
MAAAEGAAAMSAESAPATDADRLAKLWDAYRAQEDELQEALARIERLGAEVEGRGGVVAQRERDLAAKDDEIRRLHDALEQKDRRIAELSQLENDVAAVQAYKDRISELEAAYSREKERLAKLFLLYEEMERSTGKLPADRP